MTPDDLGEELETEFLAEVDKRTLREEMGPREAAEVCRSLASAFRERAAGFDEEADANDRADADPDADADE